MIQVVSAAAEERDLDEVAARMVIEVNDYPGSGANNRHDPKSPGRAWNDLWSDLICRALLIDTYRNIQY